MCYPISLLLLCTAFTRVLFAWLCQGSVLPLVHDCHSLYDMLCVLVAQLSGAAWVRKRWWNNLHLAPMIHTYIYIYIYIYIYMHLLTCTLLVHPYEIVYACMDCMYHTISYVRHQLAHGICISSWLPMTSSCTERMGDHELPWSWQPMNAHD